MNYREAPSQQSWSVEACLYIGVSGHALMHTTVGIAAHCEDKAVELFEAGLRAMGYRRWYEVKAWQCMSADSNGSGGAR